MGQIHGAPPINELVALLDRYDPAALAALRDEHPEAAAVLRPGMLAGEQEFQRLALVGLRVSHVGLATALTVGQQALTRLARRIRHGERYRLTSQVCLILVGTSAVIFPALTAELFVVRATLAVLWLIGLLTLVGGQSLQRSALGSSSAWRLHRDLTGMCAQARTLLVQVHTLAFDGAASIDSGRIQVAIAEANSLASRISELAAEEGVELGANLAPTPSSRQQMVVLLESLFVDGEELRLWVSVLPDGLAVSHHLPSASSENTRHDTFARALAVLQAHGFVDEEFFQRLTNRYPRRAHEIICVARECIPTTALVGL